MPLVQVLARIIRLSWASEVVRIVWLLVGTPYQTCASPSLNSMLRILSKGSNKFRQLTLLNHKTSLCESSLKSKFKDLFKNVWEIRVLLRAGHHFKILAAAKYLIIKKRTSENSSTKSRSRMQQERMQSINPLKTLSITWRELSIANQESLYCKLTVKNLQLQSTSISHQWLEVLATVAASTLNSGSSHPPIRRPQANDLTANSLTKESRKSSGHAVRCQILFHGES